MELGIAYLGSTADAGLLAREAELSGADAFTVGEADESAFGGCVAALATTERIVIGTNITIAFARTPIALAMEACSLMALGPGRTFYGLGSQIKQVIERRFGVEYTDPVGRMREYGEVMRRAISAKRGDHVLPFEGKHYRISQFSFFATPEPELEDLKLHLAATRPGMTRLAAEDFDGLLAHGIATPKFLQEVLRPQIGDLFMTTAVMTSIDVDVSAARERARWTLAFYGSTPAYEPAFELEGYPDLPARLRKALREEGKDAMARYMPDDVLDRFMLIGRPEDVAERLDAYEGVVDRALLGGIAVGMSREDTVANNRALIAAIKRRRQLTGAVA